MLCLCGVAHPRAPPHAPGAQGYFLIRELKQWKVPRATLGSLVLSPDELPQYTYSEELYYLEYAVDCAFFGVVTLFIAYECFTATANAVAAAVRLRNPAYLFEVSQRWVEGRRPLC